MFLLDTNIISEIRRPRPHGGVLAWLAAHRTSSIYLSAVTIWELQSGIEKLGGGDKLRASQIECWVDTVIATYDVLPVDVTAFRLAARLLRGQVGDLFMDALIAATATTRNLTVVTRNTRDFDLLGVPFIDPFRYGRS